MVRIEFPPFWEQGHFSHALGLPIDLDFGTVLGGPGATILLLGVPGTLSGPSWNSLGLPWLHPALSGHPLGRSMDSQKTRHENSIFSKENHLPGGKMLINTQENITSQSKKNNPCMSHINPPPSALRPPGCPMMPRSTPKAEKSFLDPRSRVLWASLRPLRAPTSSHLAHNQRA